MRANKALGDKFSERALGSVLDHAPSLLETLAAAAAAASSSTAGGCHDSGEGGGANSSSGSTHSSSKFGVSMFGGLVSLN